ncbi:MarR family protein [uncultured archaeon]|nr:MarR family protein [uncultured archaeon]
MEFSGNKALMGIIALLLVVLAVSVYFYNSTLNNLAAGSCTDIAGAACPHEKIVETQNVIIAVLIIVIGAIVAFIAYQFYWKKPEEKGEAISVDRKKPKKIDVSSLDTDERKVIEIVREGNGSVFQSEIVKRLGYSKVKVSRILDKMEQKGLLEKKRRGMANLVVLK